jgi:putative peptidoglycan lipid II flippase
VTEPGGRLARSAGLAGAATLVSRLLGLGRETLLAAYFGAGDQMDAYFVAFRIPNLVRDLFAEGAMSAAFVPTFTRHLTLYGKADAWRLGVNLLTALALVTGTVALGGIIFAPAIVGIYASDFSAVPGKMELTVQLTRVMLPFLPFAALAAAAMGMLNSLHHYFVPALAPATFNVASILCIVLLAPLMPSFGWPAIMAAAVGALVGGVAQVAVQWPALAREGLRYRPRLDLRDEGLRRVLLLMGPGTIGLAATQLNLFVNTLLATSQGTGAPSWLSYAFRLMYLPIGLFGVSIATAVLPAAARHAAVNDHAAVRHTLSRGLGLMLLLNVPATLGLVVLATPIVRLLFERGQFLPSDTTATAAVLQGYALGLVGYATARIVSPVFYALGQHRVPVLISTASVGINILASLLLVTLMGVRGLALGTSIAALAHGAPAVWLLRRRLQGIDGRRIASTLGRVVIASAVMAAVVMASDRWSLILVPGGNVFAQATRLGLAIGAGLATLVVCARMLNIEELDDALVRFRERFGSTGAG